MKLREEQVVGIQELFIRLTDEAFGEREGWYEPGGSGGIFGQALTVWLWLIQGMKGISMSEALIELQNGAADMVLERNSRSERLSKCGISGSTGGYSRARQRISEEDIEDITDLINKATRTAHGDSSKEYFLDGTLVTLARTKEIRSVYGEPTGAYGKRNHPLARVVFATSVKSAVSVKPAFGDYKTSEQALSSNVIESLEAGALIIGDRNFGVFPVISRIVSTGKEALVRLSSKQAHRFLKGKKTKGVIDKRVSWTKSYRDQLLMEGDATEIAGRFIRTSVKKKGYRPLELYFFTTSSLSVGELTKKYGRRVDIETDIRQLKSTLGMEELLVKTPSMVRKHLHILFTAYNLIRSVMMRIAQDLSLNPRQLSFTNALGYIGVFGKKIQKATTVEERLSLLERLRTALRQTRLPNRKKSRSEPRMLTRRRSHYPLMRGTRIAVKKRLGLL